MVFVSKKWLLKGSVILKKSYNKEMVIAKKWLSPRNGIYKEMVIAKKL